MFAQKIVDVGQLAIPGPPAQHEHVMDDAVGAFAVLVYTLQVAGQIVRDILDQGPLGVAESRPVLIDNFQQFRHHFHGDLREVIDEIQGVSDLMGDAGGELAQGRQLFLHDDLVLGPAQLDQHAFQLIVLVLQVFRQLFHQVEPLHLQGVAPEDLQRRSHIGHLVPPADFHLGLQVAPGHAAHPVGEPFQAP